VALLVAAKPGQTMTFVTEQVTAMWPTTGIALAALLRSLALGLHGC
jgi:hypothetical protein